MSVQVVKGGCCCGKVRYHGQGFRLIWFCHCEQCRRMTGHYMAAAQIDLQNIEIAGEPKWYYVSENSRHGFCPDCGSQLFWRNDNNNYLSVTGGTMDSSQDLQAGGHIFCVEKGNYYKIPEGEPQFSHWYTDLDSKD